MKSYSLAVSVRWLLVACLLALPICSACSSEDEVLPPEVKARCAEEKNKVCQPSCKDGEYRYCYGYREDFKRSDFFMRRDCLAIHVGRNCEPCEDIYSVNFGGSMKGVSCEAFYDTLYKRDKECNGCLKKGLLPVE